MTKLGPWKVPNCSTSKWILVGLSSVTSASIGPLSPCPSLYPSQLWLFEDRLQRTSGITVRSLQPHRLFPLGGSEQLPTYYEGTDGRGRPLSQSVSQSVRLCHRVGGPTGWRCPQSTPSSDSHLKLTYDFQIQFKQVSQLAICYLAIYLAKASVCMLWLPLAFYISDILCIGDV